MLACQRRAAAHHSATTSAALLTLCLQVVVNYVAMTAKGQVFDSSLDKGRPYDIRLGTGQVLEPSYEQSWTAALAL